MAIIPGRTAVSLVDPQEFAGRVALVTAAAGRGIGQAVARRLAAGGARVVVTDIHVARTKQVTEAIAADYPAATVVGYPMDAGDREQIDAVVGEVSASLGPVQILVNNAAVNVTGSIFSYDPADWDWVVRVNLTGAWYLCYRTMPLMRDAGGGVIVNIGSYAPDVGGSGKEGPYAATKGAMAALTRGLAHEGGPHKIRANFVSMGVVKGTKFVEDNFEWLGPSLTGGPLGDVPGTADIAEAVAYLASERSAYVTGEILNVSGGSYMRT
jgi:3-oxoacyl-[acyl-carrier protein] reductase